MWIKLDENFPEWNKKNRAVALIIRKNINLLTGRNRDTIISTNLREKRKKNRILGTQIKPVAYAASVENSRESLISGIKARTRPGKLSIGVWANT